MKKLIIMLIAFGGFAFASEAQEDVRLRKAPSRTVHQAKVSKQGERQLKERGVRVSEQLPSSGRVFSQKREVILVCPREEVKNTER